MLSTLAQRTRCAATGEPTLRLFGLLASIALLLACSLPTDPKIVNDSGPVGDGDDYEVYSAAINSVLFERPIAAHGAILWNRTNASGRELSWVVERFGEETIDISAIEDFKGKLGDQVELRARFDLSAPYFLASREELQRHTPGRATSWDPFLRAFPRSSYVELSRIGFSRDRTEAVVLLSYVCGHRDLCGAGYAVFCTREAGNWKVRLKRKIWVS